MLKYSVCKVCGKPISYNGVGRPKQYCEKCKKKREEQKKELLREKRRLYMVKYMSKYREKIRKTLYC